MLQIPKQKNTNPAKTYQAFAENYFNLRGQKGIIELAKQHEAIIWLNGDVINGHFYFIVDVPDGSIVHCHGVDRWLGINCEGFTVKRYNEIIHPAHALVQGYHATAIWQVLINKQLQPLQFMQPVFTALVALKKHDGGYIYCRRLCSPWQINTQGKLTQYLCRFTTVKPFENEGFATSVHSTQTTYQHVEKTIQATVQKLFEDDAFFSAQEVRVLKQYAASPAATNAEIAQRMQSGLDAVNTYNKRIIGKMEKLFMRRFYNAKQAAAYLAGMNLI